MRPSSTSALVRQRQRTVAGSVHSVLGTPAAIGISVELTPGLQTLQTRSLGQRKNPQRTRQMLGHSAGTRRTSRRKLLLPPVGSTLVTSAHLTKRREKIKPRRTRRKATRIGESSPLQERRTRYLRRRTSSKILSTTRIQTLSVRHLRTLNLPQTTHGPLGELPQPRKRKARKAKAICLRHSFQLPLCMYQ